MNTQQPLCSYGGSASNTSPAPSVEDRLSALKALKIENGIIEFVEHDDSPTMTLPDGRILGSDLPPRTIVKLVLHPSNGSNINVEVWLSDAEKWNGRFLGLGNGGSAGNIDPGGFVGPLTQGYAIATTDLGTAPNDDSGVGNPEVWKDFGFRATHLMTLAAKQIISAYYGKGPDFSYFNGVSTGGQQGLQETQRYPDDYDGIVVSVPAHCRTPLHAYFLWNEQIIKKCPFTKEQEAAIIAAGNDYSAVREAPAVAGKFVSDPRCNAKDIEAVITLAMQKDPTLTQDHEEALRKLFDGPRHAVTGERIFGGIPFGSSIAASPLLLYPFKWVFGANKSMEDINFGADIDIYSAALGPYLNAENPNLTPFEKRGGKLIMISGSADSWVPYHATLDYYERVIEHFGSLEKVKSFFLFYIVPGMGHEGGPNPLEEVRSWRENGIAPDMLRGARVADGKSEVEMPIYPYPTQTGWDAEKACFKPVNGLRAGVERVASSFRPYAAD